MHELLEFLEDVSKWRGFSTFWSLLRPENKKQAIFNYNYWVGYWVQKHMKYWVRKKDEGKESCWICKEEVALLLFLDAVSPCCSLPHFDF